MHYLLLSLHGHISLCLVAGVLLLSGINVCACSQINPSDV